LKQCVYSSKTIGQRLVGLCIGAFANDVEHHAVSLGHLSSRFAVWEYLH